MRNDAPPLTAEQAAAMARPVVSPRRRIGTRVVITLLALAALVAALFDSFIEPPVCTEAAPCLPDPLGYLVFGALAAVTFTGWIDVMAPVVGVWTFALLAVATTPPEDFALPMGYAVIVALVALIAHWPVVDRAAAAWRDRAPKRPIPETTGRARQPGVLWLPALLLVTALGFAAFGLWQQDRSDRRTAAAATATAIVESHDSDIAIVLRLVDGTTVRVPVLSQADYPVGERIRIKSDGGGLLRPVAEPQDDSGWLFVTGTVGLAGLGLQFRRWRRALAWRRLRRSPRPVCAVWYSRRSHAIYPSDVKQGDPPLAVLANPTLPTVSIAGRVEATEVRSAVLHGMPALGAYAALVPDDGSFATFGRLTKPHYWTPWPHPAGVMPAVGTRPFRLGGGDGTPQVHRLGAFSVYFAAVAFPAMIGLSIVSRMPSTDLFAVFLSAADLVGSVLLVLWWVSIRAALIWNDGGVCVADHRGNHTFEWSEVDRIDASIGYVWIIAYDRRRAGMPAGNTIAEEDLRRRLEQAWNSHDPTVRPPEIRQRRGTLAVLALAFIVAMFAAASFTR